VIVRDMASGTQETVLLAKLIPELQKRFTKTSMQLGDKTAV